MSLWSLVIHFSAAPGSQLLPWKLVWHLHTPRFCSGLRAYNLGVGGQEGICEGLVCNPCCFPFLGTGKF